MGIHKTLRNLVFVSILIPGPLFGNYEFMSAVQRIAKIYRIEVSQNNMKFTQGVEEGNNEFQMLVTSNRNNFEMVMLVGFIAAGKAMQELPALSITKVLVTVDVPVRGGYKLQAAAGKADLDNFIQGKIVSAEFVRLVKFI
tara:strand:- start:15299 stop:15721 length:423 start_codon:yes stop_codon:yes gene_type:complete